MEVETGSVSGRLPQYGGLKMVVSGIARIVSLVGIVLGLMLLMTACGSESTPPPTSAAELGVEEILDRTGESLASLSTVRFQMIDELESGTKFFGSTLKSVDGEVQSPDRAKILVAVESPAMGFAEIEIVAGGDSAFIKLFSGAPWNPLPLDEVPFNFVGLGITLSELLPLVQDPTIAGEETLGDVQTIRIEGSLVSEDLSSLLTSADSGHPITLTLWVDAVDHALQQIRLAGKLFDDDGDGTIRLIVLSDYGASIDIQLPEAASGQ